ncbi:MAG: glycosyltransferase family 4 protein [Armatimonadota bacterium]|nr:glycosyltransferase family 4 protein [Armatimonadota bacterium]
MQAHASAKRWRILQLVSSSAISGAEKHLALLSKTLQQQGHHVVTVCPPQGWLPRELQQAGVHTLPSPMHGARGIVTFWRLVRYVHKQHVDIIHTHLTRATYYGLLLGLVTRKPVVSTVHVFTSDPAYRWLSRRGYPLIAVSEAVKHWLIDYGVPAGIVQTVYNATDFVSLNGEYSCAPLEVRREFGLPEDSKLIGLFAKVSPIKGHDLLLEALPTVLRLHPNTHVLFVGSTESKFAQHTWQRAKELGVHHHVTFTGLRADVARLMQAVDVVTLPSRSETFGLVVLEAMALGKPVVATRTGGLPELVRDRETGILVDFTTTSLAHALNELLTSADLRRRLGQSARSFAQQYYTPERMVRLVESVYARALNA